VFNVVKAQLTVQGVDKTVVVGETDKAAVVTVPLKKGKSRLQTWFTCEDGETIGAYYLYVEK